MMLRCAKADKGSLSVGSPISANCRISSSGAGGRWALQASYSRLRNVSRPAVSVSAAVVGSWVQYVQA